MRMFGLPRLGVLPDVPLVAPRLREVGEPCLRAVLAAPLLLGDQIYESSVHVPSHVLGVAAHVKAANPLLQGGPYFPCSPTSSGRSAAEACILRHL